MTQERHDEKKSTLVEVALKEGESASTIAAFFAQHEFDGIEFDSNYAPVLMAPTADSREARASCIIRVVSSDRALKALHEHLDIIEVWSDTPIAEFEDQDQGF